MTTEMLAMLVASVVQGKVVAVYNRERQEVCQHLEHEAPASTTPRPQIASLQATVTAGVKVRWWNGSNVSSAAELLCVQTVPGVSHYYLIYLHLCVCV